MKRNYAIDVIKFGLSMVVLLYHFEFLFASGYLAVEGFFMISGFLMMNTLCRRKEEPSAPDSTARFVFHKYSAMFLPLLFSALSGFLIYEFLVYPSKMLQTLPERIPGLLFEVFPLQVLGFEGSFVTGVSWYLSALFISFALIHPFAKKDPKRFAYTVCPPVALLFYGFLCFQGKCLDLPCNWFLGFVNSGVIRGIAGLCAGSVLYVLIKDFGEKKEVDRTSRIGFSLLSLAGWLFIFFSMINRDLARTPRDFIVAAAIFGVLYLELSGKTYLALLFRPRFASVLGEISRYVFLNHYAWARYFLIHYPDTRLRNLLPWYFLCATASSALVWLLTGLTTRILEKRRAKQGEKI